MASPGSYIRSAARATSSAYRRLPIRWRLAGGSALLTLVILLGFAAIVGVLTTRSIQSDFDREIAAAAERDGIPGDWIDAAKRSPVRRLIQDYEVALPLHPEYRTMPMVWYIPPLSPVVDVIKDTGFDAEDKDKPEETLREEYRTIAERRVRLGLLLAEIGRSNAIQVASDELMRAMRTEAARYPGQEQQVMEFFRKNPQAAETLRGPIFEDKVVDFILELAKVEDRTVTPEELSADPAQPAPAA